MSKMDKYDDYLAKKRRDDDEDRLRKQRDIDRLNNPSRHHRSSSLHSKLLPVQSAN